jgi:hypothetical protein
MRPVDVVFQLWHRTTSETEKDLLFERTKELLPKGVSISGIPFYKKHA